MEDENPPLDLERERTLGDLFGTTLELFGRHSGLFLSVTFLVVAPVVLLIDGVWGRALAHDSYDLEHLSTGARAARSALSGLVMPALVTGLHAVILVHLSKGNVPRIGETLREVTPRALTAVAAVTAYTFGLMIGLVLLVIPGIWVAISWHFAAQAAVIDDTGPLASLRRSADLVRARWWPTAGALILAGGAVGVPSALVQAAIRQVHNGAAYVALDIVAQAVFLSLSALFGTLLFFTLRASSESRVEQSWQPPVPGDVG
jgi:hypothetical protein